MAPHVFNDLLTRKTTQVNYNYYKNETFSLGMVVLSIVCQQDIQKVYNRSLRSFNMKVFEKIKEEVRCIETENQLEKNFLRFLTTYMINADERKRLSPKRALKLLSKLVKKFSGEEASKKTMTLIEEAKEGGLGQYISKREDTQARAEVDLEGTAEEKTKEAGRVETMRDILKKQTRQLDEEEGKIVDEVEQAENLQTPTKNPEKKKRKRKNKKKKKKKKGKKDFLARMSLLNIKKLQKKISKCPRPFNPSQAETSLGDVRNHAGLQRVDHFEVDHRQSRQGDHAPQFHQPLRDEQLAGNQRGRRARGGHQQPLPETLGGGLHEQAFDKFPWV